MKNLLPIFYAAVLVFAFETSLNAQNTDKKKEPAKKEAPPKKTTANKGLKRLSELFRQAWEPKKKLPAKKNAEFIKLLPLILPGEDYLGDDLEWRIAFRDSDSDANDLITVNLSKKGSGAYERLMWFHISFKPEPRADYGNREFEGYPAMGITNVHLLVLIGHIEIRAVAAADAYKNDREIHGALSAFKLKEIEEL